MMVQKVLLVISMKKKNNSNGETSDKDNAIKY